MHAFVEVVVARLNVAEHFLSRANACAVVEITSDGTIMTANDVLQEIIGWRTPPRGHKIDDILVRAVRPLDGPAEPMQVSLLTPDGPKPFHVGCQTRAVIDGDERLTLTLLDASTPAPTVTTTGAGRLATRHARRLEILLAAARSLADARSENQMAEMLAGITRDSFEANYAAVYTLEGEGLRLLAGSNPLVDSGAPYDGPSAGIEAIREDRVILISGRDEAASFDPGLAELFDESQVQAMVIAPITNLGEPLGVISAFFLHKRTFDDQAVPLASALARQGGQVLARLRLEARVTRAANHDDTTGLPNRRLFEAEVSRNLLVGFRTLGVVFIDLDGFKGVNDAFSHSVGDALLGEVAARLRDVVRVEDAVARWGGDEFVAVFEVPDAEAAVAVADRIRTALGAPYEGITAVKQVTASVGLIVTEITDDDPVVDRLIRAADHAMYEAKMAGGNTVYLGTY